MGIDAIFVGAADRCRVGDCLYGRAFVPAVFTTLTFADGVGQKSRGLTVAGDSRPSSLKGTGFKLVSKWHNIAR